MLARMDHLFQYPVSMDTAAAAAAAAEDERCSLTNKWKTQQR